MNIEGLLELVLQEFGLLFLLQKLLLEEINLALQIRNALRFSLAINELLFEDLDLVDKVTNLLNLLLVVLLALLES